MGYQYKKKKNKFSNPYRSGFEGKFKDYLESVGVSSVVYEGEKLTYTLVHTYTPDWCIKFTDNSSIIFETKGFFKSANRTFMKAVKEQHPEKDIRIVFMKDNFLTSRKKMTYSDWCEKEGFKYHIVGSSNKFIPDEWLKEIKDKSNEKQQQQRRRVRKQNTKLTKET